MADFSYLGSGRIYLKEIGGSAGLLEVGNCSALNFSITEQTVELRDFTQPGGGTYNEVRRIESVECQITMHDLNGLNLARALYGASTPGTAGNTTAESHPGVKPGDFVAFAKIPTGSIVVRDSTPTVLVEGTDYEVRPGGVYILPTTTLVNPAGETISVDYAHAAADVVQALVNSGKEYEMVFAGLNEARSGKATVVKAYRVKIGAAANLGLIGEEYAALEVTGKLLKDTSKTGAGVSQYFQVGIQA